MTPHAREDQPPVPQEFLPFGVAPLPAVQPPAPQVSRAQSVSAGMLRHPLTKKARKLLARAQTDSHLGKHDQAIRELNDALSAPSAEPYVRSFLGVEYLEIHNPWDAIPQLERAAQELPRLSMVHSNLALALCQTGQIQNCLSEVDTALKLDPGAARAHFLKGVLLLDQGRVDHETLKHLELAEKEVSTAHLALAIYYALDGHDNLAQEELEAYARIRPLSIERMRSWLQYATSGTLPGEALGMWRYSSDRGE